MNIDLACVATIARKEFRDYRRNRLVVLTMAAPPVVFVAVTLLILLDLPADTASGPLNASVGLSVLLLLLVPATVPSVVAAYAIVGEREQETLEPLLTTPVRSEELLIGKALAATVPTLAMSYTFVGLVLACTALFANAVVSSAVFRAPLLIALVLFTPLIAVWTIWISIAISVRSRDVRTAQQLAGLASLVPAAVAALISFGVIPQSLPMALALAAGLVVVDALGWRAVAALFDRERLVTKS